jgi:hypothetical protein
MHENNFCNICGEELNNEDQSCPKCDCKPVSEITVNRDNIITFIVIITVLSYVLMNLYTGSLIFDRTSFMYSWIALTCMIIFAFNVHTKDNSNLYKKTMPYIVLCLSKFVFFGFLSTVLYGTPFLTALSKHLTDIRGLISSAPLIITILLYTNRSSERSSKQYLLPVPVSAWIILLVNFLYETRELMRYTGYNLISLIFWIATFVQITGKLLPLIVFLYFEKQNNIIRDN